MNCPSYQLLALLLALSLGTPAQGSSLDELFQNLDSDVVVTGPLPTTPRTLDRPMFLYFGTLETQGVLAGGWTDEARRSTATSLYYYLHLQGGIDVKPIPEARLIGTFSTFLPQDLDPSIIATLKDGNTQNSIPKTTPSSVNTSSSLALDELYLDYDILRAATFRIGKFGATWGQGRIFNPGNLVADTSGSVNLRGFVPLGPVTLTGIVIGNTGFFQVKTKPRAEELGYAGDMEFTLGPVAGGVSAHHQLTSGSSVDLALRTALWGFDLYADGLGTTRYGDVWLPGVLVGIDREVDLGVKFRAVGEYWYSGQQYGPDGRSLGLGLTTNGFGSANLRLSSKWIHSLTDGSGQVVVGLTATPLPKLDVVIGLPWTYGPATGVYVLGNADPEKRLLAAMLSVNVKLDFEKDH